MNVHAMPRDTDAMRRAATVFGGILPPANPVPAWKSEHFERCWPLLEKALEVHDGTFTKDDVWQAIASEKVQMWPTANAIVLTSVELFPTGMKEIRGWLTGGDLGEILSLEDEISNWARSIGCKRFVLTGRRGWVKALPRFREMATFLAKDL